MSSKVIGLPQEHSPLKRNVLSQMITKEHQAEEAAKKVSSLMKKLAISFTVVGLSGVAAIFASPFISVLAGIMAITIFESINVATALAIFSSASIGTAAACGLKILLNKNNTSKSEDSDLSDDDVNGLKDLDVEEDPIVADAIRSKQEERLRRLQIIVHPTAEQPREAEQPRDTVTIIPGLFEGCRASLLSRSMGSPVSLLQARVEQTLLRRAQLESAKESDEGDAAAATKKESNLKLHYVERRLERRASFSLGSSAVGVEAHRRMSFSSQAAEGYNLANIFSEFESLHGQRSEDKLAQEAAELVQRTSDEGDAEAARLLQGQDDGYHFED